MKWGKLKLMTVPLLSQSLMKLRLNELESIIYLDYANTF